jgi:hypothetical protein
MALNPSDTMSRRFPAAFLPISRPLSKPSNGNTGTLGVGVAPDGLPYTLRALTLFMAHFWVGYYASHSFPILGQAFPVNDQHATCEDARSNNQTCDRRT